jgi:hypothetical protein
LVLAIKFIASFEESRIFETCCSMLYDTEKYQNMKKIALLCSLILLTTVLVFGQKKVSKDLKGIIYDHEKALDLRVHTHGWAANVQFGQLKTYYRTQYYQVGLGELKHVKEVGSSTDFSNLTQGAAFRKYTYGKQNYAYTLRGGWGMKRYYSEKAEKKGVAVGVNYSGGLSMGLMVPYYLEVSTAQRDGSTRIIKYTPETATLFTDRQRVRGKGGIFKGVPETKIVPGFYGQAGVHLDWGAFDEFLRAVEVGVQLDVFTKKLPILISDNNKPYFLNFYASLQLGKRR